MKNNWVTNFIDLAFFVFIKFYTKKNLKKQKNISEIIIKNRKILNGITDWIDHNAFNNSVFKYGIPDSIKDKINLPIGNEINYTDLLVAFAKNYPVSKYLEIGVSVGKNFVPLLENIENAQFFGFDIEKINPIIEKKLIFINECHWPSKNDSLKKDNSYLKVYKYNYKNISYLCGDIYDENSWERLRGNKFNLIFSDALHTPEAILFEMNLLLKHDLIGDKFIIVWDDIYKPMQYSFWQIFKLLKSKYNLKRSNIFIIKINGWMGQNENKHTVGIISSYHL